MSLVIHIDGGARGNPGPAGAGVLITSDKGQRIHEAGYFLGRQTNNSAEYTALILALRRAIRAADGEITIYSDSELLVQQITGEYRVKNPNLAKLHGEAQRLLLKVDSWTIRHVRRERNRRADQLVNMAIDESRDVIVFDRDGPGAQSVRAQTKPGSPADPLLASQTEDDDAGAAAEEEEAAAGAELPAAVNADGSAVAWPAAGGAKPNGLGAPADSALRTHAVRVVLAAAPEATACPLGGCGFSELTIEDRMPGGVCLHAAHALLPTVLAIKNTDSREFAAIPTLTVSCMFSACGSKFHLSPVKPTNGATQPGSHGK